MTTLYLLLASAAAAGFYLASPHQGLWLNLRTPRRLLRGAAWFCLLLAVLAAAVALGFWTGFFAALTAFMLAAVCLPYLDAYQGLSNRGDGDVG